MAETNAATYKTAHVVGFYDQYFEGLQPPEAAILELIAGELTGREALDIGIGVGRTTPHLLALAASYVGIDYSEGMIEVARRRFPGVDLRHGDARDLSEFADESMGFVMFSFNGLDYVDHADRLQVLGEVRRVLAPNGLFLFSSHNRACPKDGLKTLIPPMVWTWNPAKLAVRTGRALAETARRGKRLRRNRRLEAETPGHSIRCDPTHDRGLLTYYITRAGQEAQLLSTGFVAEAVYNLSGEPAGSDCIDSWLTYLARAK